VAGPNSVHAHGGSPVAKRGGALVDGGGRGKGEGGISQFAGSALGGRLVVLGEMMFEMIQPRLDAGEPFVFPPAAFDHLSD
jgi:hypothetical protein